MKWVAGVDLGGTSIVVGLVPEGGGTPLAVQRRATEARRGPEAVVEDIGAMVADAVGAAAEDGQDGHVVGVGVGAPGPLDLKTGVVRVAPNLGWRDYPLRSRIEARVDLPVSLDNDANCATYGEWWQGAARGYASVVGITVGTGIGGGLVLDGAVVHGASGAAGEIGHTTINVGGRRCACGNYGCLEAYASGPNIAARAREGLEAGAGSVLVDLVEGRLDRLTARTVYDALVLGDEYAREVILETARFLGAGVANVVNLLNPEVVVVVGGVTQAGEHLLAPLRSEVRRRAFRAAANACRILPGALPETAGVVGAAGLFLQSRNG